MYTLMGVGFGGGQGCGGSRQSTEVRFASLLSGRFITAIVGNPPERKLAKRTAVLSG